MSQPIAVPFSGLAAQYRRLKPELDAAVARVLASGWYIGGPEVEAFEAAFARFAKAPYAIGVANGTDAIALSLVVCGVHPGDEVIIPAVSAYPTALAVVQARAVPVFVDVKLEDGLIDPQLVEQAITPRTRAVVPVHLYGSVANLGRLTPICKAAGIPMIEDCAQAHGALYEGRPAGEPSAAAAWSFYPTKNLGAVGDAGAITTDHPDRAERLRRLRNYGQRNRYEHVELSGNSRLDPIQAALLCVKLKYLEEENAKRRELAARYEKGLAGVKSVTVLQVSPGVLACRHLFPIRILDADRRESLQQSLARGGIETLIHYPIPMPDQTATDPAWRRRNQYPNARELCRSVLSLPLYPDLTFEQVDRVVNEIGSWSLANL